MEAILKAHGIKIKNENGILFVLEEWFCTITKKNGSQWLNTSNWGMNEVRIFLGY